MEKCNKCGVDYPDGYLSPIMGTGVAEMVCGICALELSNQVLGINRTEFQGEMAEDLRQDAIAYRKQKGITI